MSARGPRPLKSLGQHWLLDRRVVERIIAAVKPSAADLIVEIGPGRGALTGELVRHAGHVVAFELDKRLIGELRHAYDGPRCAIVEADVTKLDLRRVVTETKAEHGLERARVVANLPYNISSPVLVQLAAARSCLLDATLMLQREVVDRVTARPGSKDYGALTVLMNYHCQATRLFDVPAGAFRPVPKVTSAVLRLEFREAPVVEVSDEEFFFAVVRRAFGQRRKTLGNALRGLVDRKQFEAAGVDPGRRAETLSVEEFARLVGLETGRHRT
jgi:16S rRNA (adenine1518-N6/adenine1519-N6)-dimethyltransferase